MHTHTHLLEELGDKLKQLMQRWIMIYTADAAAAYHCDNMNNIHIASLTHAKAKKSLENVS